MKKHSYILKICLVCVLVFFGEILSGQSKVWHVMPPAGYMRQETDEFGVYLRNLPLKSIGTPVRYYDGNVKGWQGGAYAVVDMEIGTSDLQQCADAVMRLRAEFLWGKGRYEEIHFNFTNGFRADYKRWTEGYRISVKGNVANWYKATEEDYSYATFRQYLDKVFMYAGTASLSKELESVPIEDVRIGDIFIRGGHPGHAMIIVDVVHDAAGNKAILVAQSYMPAQDIHIVTNPLKQSDSPWYKIDKNTTEFKFPEANFTTGDIKRFK